MKKNPENRAREKEKEIEKEKSQFMNGMKTMYWKNLQRISPCRNFLCMLCSGSGEEVWLFAVNFQAAARTTKTWQILKICTHPIPVWVEIPHLISVHLHYASEIIHCFTSSRENVVRHAVFHFCSVCLVSDDSCIGWNNSLLENFEMAAQESFFTFMPTEMKHAAITLSCLYFSSHLSHSNYIISFQI